MEDEEADLMWLACPDADNPDWPKRTRDFWIGVTDPERLADLMGQEVRTPAALEAFLRLPGVRLASDSHLLMQAAEILRARRNW